ncbi:MAG: O-methyltransferase involved in polyketide biosynthesis [Gammaproteobacteria bacterium]|jgi:O-methyltransferase involved in polyketide biosynthesis
MWYRYGLSHRAFTNAAGRSLDRLFSKLAQPAIKVTGLSFDDLMLARHRGIDDALTQAIDTGHVTQVIELAAGLSPRGWRMTKKYGESILYVETDLPHMITRKETLLDRNRLRGPRHSVQAINVLSASGADSLAALFDSLDPTQGVAIISEGLLNYLDDQQLMFALNNIANVLQTHEHNIFLADYYLNDEIKGVITTTFLAMLKTFVRGHVSIHDANVEMATRRLKQCGFTKVTLPTADTLPSNKTLNGSIGARKVHILQASAHKT